MQGAPLPQCVFLAPAPAPALPAVASAEARLKSGMYRPTAAMRVARKL